MFVWLADKSFNAAHYMQTLQPNVFIPGMLIGIIEFFHLVPLSLTLTLAGGYKVSAKQDLPLCLILFSSDQDEVWC